MQKFRMNLLSREQIESQLSQIDLLMGMYPGEEEIAIDAGIIRWLDLLRQWVTGGEEDGNRHSEVESAVPDILYFDINLSIEVDDDRINADKPYQVQLNIEVPVRAEAEAEASSIKVRLRQPTWMNRAQTSQLNASVPADYTDDIFATIEYFKDEAGKCIVLDATSDTSQNLFSSSGPLIRVWFYFPSLSTRAKRADLVTYGPVYDLTGFVLAGKPGVLCVEGTSKNVDEYMKFIKTESWRDIPSHHKKVSEKYRESVEGGRVFTGMQEITDAGWMGEKRGERGNRNDLRALEGWLDGLGLKGVFEKVFL